MWDNVSFHGTHVIGEWFHVPQRMLMEFLPPFSPFLNPVKELFSAWTWKVYDHRPEDQRRWKKFVCCNGWTLHGMVKCFGWLITFLRLNYSVVLSPVSYFDKCNYSVANVKPVSRNKLKQLRKTVSRWGNLFGKLTSGLECFFVFGCTSRQSFYFRHSTLLATVDPGGILRTRDGRESFECWTV